MAHGIDDDLGDLALAVAERGERRWHGLVDDLEVAAAGELLELHEREVGLDAGGVAVHDEADRSGRRDHGRLRVAETVVLAKRDGAVPGAACRLYERPVRAGRMVERHRRNGELVKAVAVAVGGAAMIADDAQHFGGVGLIAREWPELARHLSRGRVGDAGHDGGDGAADRATRVGVIRNA